MGVFFLELDELSTPETTENFIKYVAAGRYDNTFVYGTTNASFLRGGGHTFNTCPLSVGRIEPIGSVLPESTMLSNSGGVISMMLRNKATDVITSDWTISISDNRSYDGSDYGYIPFGRVLGYGMEAVETIAFGNYALGPEILGGPADNLLMTRSIAQRPCRTTRASAFSIAASFVSVILSRDSSKNNCLTPSTAFGSYFCALTP